MRTVVIVLCRVINSPFYPLFPRTISGRRGCLHRRDCLAVRSKRRRGGAWLARLRRPAPGGGKRGRGGLLCRVRCCLQGNHHPRVPRGFRDRFWSDTQAGPGLTWSATWPPTPAPTPRLPTTLPTSTTGRSRANVGGGCCNRAIVANLRLSLIDPLARVSPHCARPQGSSSSPSHRKKEPPSPPPSPPSSPSVTLSWP